MDELKKQHDDILANRPESMSDEEYASIMEAHKDTCSFCNDNLIAQENPTEGGDMEKTFTQEELDAAVKAAVAPIQTELDSLKETATQSEVETRVAEAKAEAETRMAEVQEELDAAVLAAETAKKEIDDIKSFLDSQKEEAEIAEWFNAVRAERVEKIKDVANFPEDYMTEERINRWCSKDEAEFAAWIDDIKVNAGAKAKAEKEENSDSAILDTAIQVVRSEEEPAGIKADLANLFDAARAGFDIKRI